MTTLKITAVAVAALFITTSAYSKSRVAESYIFCDQRGCRQSDELHQAPKVFGEITRKANKRARRVVSDVVASGDYLVDKARHYLGTNPTGWRSLWCGRFMAMIAPDAAAQVKNPNRARSWASLPRTSPSIGAIAVMTRGKTGGHVGVVTGFDANGNPIVISGNHNNRVDEGVYPRSRVIAYVSGS